MPPPNGRQQLILSIPDLVKEKREAESDAEWYGSVDVDLSGEGLEKSARGGASMPTKTASEPSDDMADLSSSLVRDGVDTILKTLTGVGLEELQRSVVEGTLPDQVGMRLLAPVANVSEALVRGQAKRAGTDPKVTDDLAESVRIPVMAPVTKLATDLAAQLGMTPERATAVGTVTGMIAGIFGTPSGTGAISAADKAGRLSKMRSVLFPPSKGGRSPGLNVPRLTSDVEVAALITRMQEASSVGKRTISHAETVASSKGAMTLDEALSTPLEYWGLEVMRAQQTSLRDLYGRVAGEIDALQKAAAKGDGKAAEDLLTAYAIGVALMERAEVAAAGAGRLLNAWGIDVDPTRITLEQLKYTQARTLGMSAAVRAKAEVQEATRALGEAVERSGIGRLERQHERVKRTVDDLTAKVADAKEVAGQHRNLTEALAAEQATAAKLQEQLAGPPPAKKGFVRLFRGEALPSGKKLPDWITRGLEESGARDAAGRWYTDDPKIAKWYLTDAAAGGKARLKYVDVPTDVFEASRVAKNPEARKFSADPDREFFLPREWADKAKEAEAGLFEKGRAVDAVQKKVEAAQRKIDDLTAKVQDLELAPAQLRSLEELLAADKAQLADLTERLKGLRKTERDVERAQTRVLAAQKTLDKLSTESREAGERVTLGQASVEDEILAIRQRLSTEGIDGMTLARLLAQLPKAQQPAMLSKIARYYRGANDVLHWAFLQTILSGPATHVANALGTGAVMGSHIPERYAAEWINRVLTRDPAGVRRGETWAALNASGQGLSDGVRLMARTWRTGAQPFGPAKVEARFDLTSSYFGLDPTTPLGTAIDWAGRAQPTRMLIAADALGKGYVKRTELAALAWREALARGTRPEDMERVVAQLMDAPTVEMLRLAEEAANLRTLNQELGAIGKAAITLRNTVPGGWWIAPFLQTPGNSFKWAYQRSPVLGLLSIQNWRDIAAGGAARDMAIARITLGQIVGGAIAYHVLSGNITGALPVGSNPNLKRDYRQSGRQPYAFRIGDEPIGYRRTDPLGQYIGTVATGIELYSQIGRRDDAPMDYLDWVQAVVIAGGRVAMDAPMLYGLHNLLEAIAKPDERWKSFWRQQARSLVPAALRQVTRSGVPGVIDARPELRELESITDALKAGIPDTGPFGVLPTSWTAVSLPPALHPITGDPMVRPAGWGPDVISPLPITTRVDDPVLDAILRNGMNFAEPSRNLLGTGDPGRLTMDPAADPVLVRMTPHQFYRLVSLATREIRDGQGRTLHAAMAAKITEHRAGGRDDGGPDGPLETRLHVIYSNFYDRARMALRREYPELDAHMRDQQRQRIQRRSLAPTLGR